MKIAIFFCGCIAIVLHSGTTVNAITSNQFDDFQISADSANWTGGNPIYSPPPTQIADGGPNGASDGYLKISVDGFHLGTYNQSQWAGDYITAGVTDIEMDVNLLDGPNSVSLRILLFGIGGTWASTILAPELTAPGWQHVSFGLSIDDLSFVGGGSGVLNDTLANVQKLLLRHDRLVPTPPGNHPPHITATLGIDNITALPCAQRGSQGDFNCDAVVGLLDLDILGTNWGSTGLDPSKSYKLGDANSDGTVGLLDLDQLGNNWGQPTSVPEPATIGLFAITTVILLRRN